MKIKTGYMDKWISGRLNVFKPASQTLILYYQTGEVDLIHSLFHHSIIPISHDIARSTSLHPENIEFYN
jgi:hypothetical protein